MNARRFIIRLVARMDALVPKRNAVVMRGYPDIEDQCISIVKELSRRGYEGRVTWIIRNPSCSNLDMLSDCDREGVKVVFRKSTSILALLDFIRARYVLFTHGLYSQGDWGNYAPPKGKIVVNMWHGMPVKAIWRFLKETREAPMATALVATSLYYQEIMAKASGFSVKDVWMTGLPRNDMLYYNTEKASEVVYRQCKQKKFLLYLPTYRKSCEGDVREDGIEHDSILNMSSSDVDFLVEWLNQNNIVLVVKPHPMSLHAKKDNDASLEGILRISEEWLGANGITLYQLAGASSGLITDLSSIAVDYVLLQRPIFSFFPDRNEYLTSRGAVLDCLSDHFPGPVSVNVESLVEELNSCFNGSDRFQEARRRIADKWHSLKGISAAKSVLDRMGV